MFNKEDLHNILTAGVVILVWAVCCLGMAAIALDGLDRESLRQQQQADKDRPVHNQIIQLAQADAEAIAAHNTLVGK